MLATPPPSYATIINITIFAEKDKSLISGNKLPLQICVVLQKSLKN